MSDYLFKVLAPGKNGGVDVIGVIREMIDNYATAALALTEYPEINCNIYQPQGETMRVTYSVLNKLAEAINNATSAPTEYSLTRDGKHETQIGHFHVSRAYGGVCLNKTVNESGAAIDVFNCGHVSNAELQIRMRAFLQGIKEGQK